MSEIRAAQLIFGTFTAEQSPRGKGGLQTAFRSSSLDERDIDDIEGRLLYYFSSTFVVKRLFFAIRGEKTVISQIVPLTTGSDSSARGGLYLGHALIVDAGDLSRVRPWQVLDSFSFARSITEALERGNRETGEIPEMTIPLRDPESVPAVASLWTADALQSLALWALQASRLAREQMSLAFTGSEPQVRESIETAMLAVPGKLLRQCSFDTYFYKCNPAKMYYWGVGLPDAPNASRYLIVDAISRRIPTHRSAAAETSFEKWAIHSIREGNLDVLAQCRDYAFDLFEWLDGRAEQPELERMPDPVVRYAFGTKGQLLQARLRERMSRHYPSTLSQRASEQFLKEASPQDVLHSISRGVDESQIASLAFAVFEAGAFQKPGREEVRWASEIAKRGAIPKLLLICLCWNSEYVSLRQQLARLDVNDYVDFLRLAIQHRFVPLIELLIRGRGEHYSETVLKRGSNLVDSDALVARMIDLDDPEGLVHLLPMLSSAPGEQLAEMDRLISSNPRTPIVFRERLAEALKHKPTRKGFLNNLFGRGSRQK